MPNTLYDSDQEDKNDLVPRSDKVERAAGLEERAPVSGDNSVYDGEGGDQKRSAAQQQLQQSEQKAIGKGGVATGGISMNGGAPLDPTNIIGSAKAATDKAALKAKEEGVEEGGFFNADKDKKEDKPKGKGRLTRRQKAGGMLALFTLIGGGGMGAVAVLQGPLEFIDISQELSEFHLDPQSDQGDNRVFKIMRYIRYYKQSAPERTRMSIVGNKIADRMEKKFNNAGIESRYTKVFGFQDGVIIDPQKLSASDFKKLQGKNSADVVTYFQEKYGVPVTPYDVSTDGHTRFLIDTNKIGYFKFNALTRDLMRSAGYHWVVPGISGRKMAVRGGIKLHWLNRKIDETLKTQEERFAAIEEEENKRINGGAQAPEIVATGETDKDGKPVGDSASGADATNEIAKEAKDALAAKAGGDATAIDKFKAAMTSKYGLWGAGIVGLVCAAYAVGQNIDKINKNIVEGPLKQVGMGEGVSVGQQIMANSNDISQDHLAVLEKKNYNPVAKPGVPAGDWSNNNATLANRGLPQSAEPAPKNFNIDPQGNVITQFLAAFGPGLDGVCKVVNSTIGVVVLTGLSFTPGAGVAKNILQLATGALAAQLIIGWIVDIFTANVVDPAIAGPIHGYAYEYGTMYAANDIGLTKAALPVSPLVATQIQRNSSYATTQEFQSKSLAYRLFSTQDSHSFIAQALNKAAPDPGSNIASASRGMLNIGQSFGSMFSSIFSKTVGAAAAQPYNYGVPTIIWDQASMDDPAFDNPFANADHAADVLDARPDLIDRVKKCFGVSIVKIPDDNGKMAYSIAPPVQGEDPTYADILNPDNNCAGNQVATIHTPTGDKQIKLAAIDHDYTSVRMFVNDSTIMSGIGCVEDDEQSCIDAGQEPDPNAGAGATTTTSAGGTGTPTCATTASTTDMPAGGYTLAKCEDFSGTTLPAGWSAYNSPASSTVVGSRNPAQCSVGGDLLTLTQDADGNTCGVSSDYEHKYGYWEVKMLAKETGGTGNHGHPVLLLWPNDHTNPWPGGGELDYFETNFGSPAAGFLHCANSVGGNCYTIPDNPVDYSQFHTYAIEWAPSGFTGYIDKKLWYSTSDARAQPPGAMHQTVQLDAPGQTKPLIPAIMQVDWVHVYTK